MGAVGEQHIVELVNEGYAIYRKSDGVLLESTSTLDEFWNAAGVTSFVGVSFDPRVLYDAASQRWFAVALDGGVTSRTQGPEPGTGLLVLTSLGGLALRHRRRG